jgi:hypothetical protein
MNSIYVDAKVRDDLRREQIYRGQLYVYSPLPSSRALCDFARELCEQAFAPFDPRMAQHEMEVERFASILSELKPRFIHHPESKRLIQSLLVEMDCDPVKTYFDVPRLRTSTSNDYLNSGISYAFHPHRDTWYSAPFCQINWWIPVYEVVPENVMAFHPRYWNQPVRNSSRVYNYDEWNRTSRQTAGQHIKTDTRVQPRPEEELELDPQVRVVAPVSGMLLFSGAHLHSTVPNNSGTTRFSIDFRTVHIDDARALRCAPNIDSACTGTSMGDYLRGTDLVHLPDELIEMYGGLPVSGPESLAP